MHHQRFAFASAFSPLAFVAIAAIAPLAGCGATTNANIGPASDGGSDATQPSGDDGAASDDGGAAPDGSVTLPTACADWAQARCARLDACSNTTYTVVHYGSQATCIANSAAQCARDLAATQTAATPSFFEGCANAITTESCADLFGANLPAACAPLTGPAASGAPCFVAAQCQSTYCAVPQFATCGACAAVPKSGDACAIDADCGGRDHLTCSKAGTCVAYGASGGACGKDAPCGPGLSCVGANAKKSVAGACAAAASTVGAACDTNQQTAPGCDAELSLVCDPATSKCIAFSLADANAACGVVAGGIARCESGGTCLLALVDAGADDAGSDAGAPAASTSGTCVAAASIGSACNATSTPGCVAPAKCVIADVDAGTGTCQVADPTTCP